MSPSLHFTLTSNIDEFLKLMERSKGKGKWRKRRKARRKVFRPLATRINKDLVGSLKQSVALVENYL